MSWWSRKEWGQKELRLTLTPDGSQPPGFDQDIQAFDINRARTKSGRPLRMVIDDWTTGVRGSAANEAVLVQLWMGNPLSTGTKFGPSTPNSLGGSGLSRTVHYDDLGLRVPRTDILNILGATSRAGPDTIDVRITYHYEGVNS